MWGKTALLRFTRSFRTTAVKQGGHHEPEGFPGANLPFDINNKYKLVGLFAVFCGTGFSLPFLLLRHHLTK